MSYQALYRVWRPNRFADLVGQHHVTKTLQNAIVFGKLSHAYLFTGPRGTGKTTAARIVAKAVNCENSPAEEPCNECATCTSINEGSNQDVIEIDAASHRGIDNIRELRDKVKYVPSQGKMKVYIIDEVHMLSTEAFNALLKTLEEPPSHVMFILATTEPHRLPLTIISRCQRFDFKQISNKAMLERMKLILDSEGINAPVQALTLVARAAEGGMRDALSILDQVISFSESEITLDDVLAVTDTVSEAFLARTVQAFLQQQVEEALQLVNDLFESGKDPMRFLEELLYYLRDLLLYKTAPTLEDVQERANSDELFSSLAREVEKEWIYTWIEQLNESQQAMRWTTNKRVFLEVAFVKVCQERTTKDEKLVSQLQTQLTHLKSEVAQLKQQIANQEHRPATPSIDERSERPAQPVRHRDLKKSFVHIERMLQKATKQHLQQLQKGWVAVMEAVRKEKVSAHAWIKDSRPVACTEDTFLLSFPYEMHSHMAASQENIRTTVERAVESVYKRPLHMLTIVDEDWEVVKQNYIRSQQQEERQKEKKKDEEEPHISEAKRLFGEELVEFK